MKDDSIEKLLSKAPKPSPPEGLLSRLQSDVLSPQPTSTRVSGRDVSPWWRRWTPAFAAIVILFSCGGLLAAQLRTLAALREENRALRARVAQLESAPAKTSGQSAGPVEMDRLSRDRAAIEARNAEIPSLRNQSPELMLVQTDTSLFPTDPVATGLVWDAVSKRYEPKLGDNSVQVAFSFTNLSHAEIVINTVIPSCGCTVVKLPAMPWRVAPGTSGVLAATVDLASKPVGMSIKTIAVESSAGPQELRIEIIVPEAPQVGDIAARIELIKQGFYNSLNLPTGNMRLVALQDRQAIFTRNECASCHAEPAKGKKGAELFAAVCANCHESKNRSPAVPDLAKLPVATTRDFWNTAVAKGKTDSMMPAFAKSEGGPLDDEQIQSLVEYLLRWYSQKITDPRGAFE